MQLQEGILDESIRRLYSIITVGIYLAFVLFDYDLLENYLYQVTSDDVEHPLKRYDIRFQGKCTIL